MLPYRERGVPASGALRCGVLLLQGNIRCSSISAYGSVRLYKKQLRPLAHAPARTVPCFTKNFSIRQNQILLYNKLPAGATGAGQENKTGGIYMREDICTIPISEVFEPKEGCPICRMRDTLENRVPSTSPARL